MTPEELWHEIRACFEQDDGSLPSIELNNVSPDGVASIYRMVLERSFVQGSPRTFWNRAAGREDELDSVDNPASLVATGVADTFHLVLAYQPSNGVTMPELGFTVWPDGVEFDYRMGFDWGPEQVSAFFDLLYQCIKQDAAAVLSLELDGPAQPQHFMSVWERYRRIREATL